LTSKTLRLSDAARYLPIGRSKLNELALAGEVARVRLAGTWRYTTDDLDAYKQRQYEKTVPAYLQVKTRGRHNADPLYQLPIMRGDCSPTVFIEFVRPSPQYTQAASLSAPSRT
jgi:hypothetical protein